MQCCPCHARLFRQPIVHRSPHGFPVSIFWTSLYDADLRANQNFATACHRRRLPISLPQGATRCFELDAQLPSVSAAPARGTQARTRVLLLSTHLYIPVPDLSITAQYKVDFVCDGPERVPTNRLCRYVHTLSLTYYNLLAYLSLHITVVDLRRFYICARGRRSCELCQASSRFRKAP